MTQAELEALVIATAADTLVTKAVLVLSAAGRDPTPELVARLANGWTNTAMSRDGDLKASIVVKAQEFLHAVPIARHM